MNCVDRAEMSITMITEIAMTVPAKVGVTHSVPILSPQHEGKQGPSDCIHQVVLVLRLHRCWIEGVSTYTGHLIGFTAILSTSQNPFLGGRCLRN